MTRDNVGRKLRFPHDQGIGVHYPGQCPRCDLLRDETGDCPSCGYKDHKCGVSSGICGRVTFGSGKLGHYGYWEKPCAPCARDWEKRHPDEKAWPPEE